MKIEFNIASSPLIVRVKQPPREHKFIINLNEKADFDEHISPIGTLSGSSIFKFSFRSDTTN